MTPIEIMALESAANFAIHTLHLTNKEPCDREGCFQSSTCRHRLTKDQLNGLAATLHIHIKNRLGKDPFLQDSPFRGWITSVISDYHPLFIEAAAEERLNFSYLKMPNRLLIVFSEGKVHAALNSYRTTKIFDNNIARVWFPTRDFDEVHTRAISDYQDVYEHAIIMTKDPSLMLQYLANSPASPTDDFFERIARLQFPALGLLPPSA